ncbi:MAG: endonuclease MutS2 [Clostridia bacterium]|nr:endonuclease MutS2 [Clostridia bacterium]
MTYLPEKTCRTLELDKVLLKLSDEASMPDAKGAALNLLPVTSIFEVQTLLNQTNEAYQLAARYGGPQFGAHESMIASLSRAELGAVLSMGELLSIASFLVSVRKVSEWHQNGENTETPALLHLFSMLCPNKFLEDKISFSIQSPDTLYDNASATLADLRRKIKSKSNKIREDLDKIIHGPSARWLQDAIITQRDGRFVVPVKIEHRGEVKGIVHDTSSTGSTLFVEPMSVVETNNEIRVLELKEQEEIIRILSELSAAVSDFSDAIKQSYNAMVELNLIFAKVKLADKMGAVVPKLNDNGCVYLKRARHPLIPQKQVVPITVSLGKEFDTLIITGPNTGGKTVTLKTIGLLTLMTMCGLMIPVDESSEISVFSQIFADIGDEQSIAQNLSTFSSHMANIIQILSLCNDQSLVLFDELCAGTDPIEGAALAKSILIQLTEKRVKTVATTHYAELKAYALDTPRVENAACEFDIATLKPTYRLIIGTPGRSNAFAISRRLGLDESIISAAKSQISDDDLRFERVVASLESARQQAEEDRKIAADLRLELNRQKKTAEEKMHELSVKQDKIMSETREKARYIIEDAREKAAAMLNRMEDFHKQLKAENAAKMLESARADYKKTISSLEKAADPVVEKNVGQPLESPPSVGDTVLLSDFNREASVLAVDERGKRAQVLSGSMKLWVSFDSLRLSKKKANTSAQKTRRVTGLFSRAERNVKGEIDLRGMASDEAILEVDRYLDQAVLSGIETVHLIHGKGTGTLRKAIQAHLKKHRLVKSYRLGTFGEGESGVTVVSLAD